MRKQMEGHIDKMTTQFKTRLSTVQEKSAAESKKLKEDNAEATGKLVKQLKSLTTSATNLKNEKEDLQSKLKTLKEEMDLTVQNNSSTASSLLEQQEKLEYEKKSLQFQLDKVKAENEANSNKVEELTGKLDALTKNLHTLIDEGREKDEKLKVAARNDSRLRTSEAEVTELREQLNKIKLEHTKNSNLVNRLQAEKEANERNQGQRTAMVGMLETQLAELNEKNSDLNAKLEATRYDLSERNENLQNAEERLAKLEGELRKAQDATNQAKEALQSAQKGADSRNNKMVEALQRELQTTRQQMAKKSSAAQKMLQEREKECAELRKTNKTLQHEVDKGSLSDRRIFELAEKQSNRETGQAGEIDIRNKQIDQLRSELSDRDGVLATMERHVQEVEAQLEEICRTRRREDVNLDYLKDVVVKYLALPSGSSERARLLPVLATLLQFNPNDYNVIEEGKQKLSWWGSVAPTLISSPPGSVPPPRSSAEVAVGASTNANAATPNGKRTSLLF